MDGGYVSRRFDTSPLKRAPSSLFTAENLPWTEWMTRPRTGEQGTPVFFILFRISDCPYQFRNEKKFNELFIVITSMMRMKSSHMVNI